MKLAIVTLLIADAVMIILFLGNYFEKAETNCDVKSICSGGDINPYVPHKNYIIKTNPNENICKQNTFNCYSMVGQNIDLYKEVINTYRSEVDNFKWMVTCLITLYGITVAILAILCNQIYKKYASETKVDVEKAKKEHSFAEKERLLTEKLSEANAAYQLNYYGNSVQILKEIQKDYKLESRQFYNNLGSALLGLAKQKEGAEKEKLLEEAAENYKKAENYTSGVAAYNLACIYSMLDQLNECKKYLELARDKERIPTKKRVEEDPDLKNIREKENEWFAEFLRTLK